MLLQKFPKTVSYTVIMAVIPKINENSASGGGGMRSVRYPMKIGILTYFFASNYGAALQAWALTQLLWVDGAQAELINYRCPALARPYAVDQIAA